MIKNKQRFTLVMLGLLAIILLIVAYFLQTPNSSKRMQKSQSRGADSLNSQEEGQLREKREPVSLPKKMTVENELKIEVEPVHVSDDQVQFTVALASYQNSDSVGMNPLETTILLDEEDTPYAPVQWDISQEDEYNKVGVLTFNISHFPKSLRLSIFELEERIFEWSLVAPDAE